MDSVQEVMEDFMEELSEEFELDHTKVVQFCFRNYELELNVETNKRSIRYRIEHEEKTRAELV